MINEFMPKNFDSDATSHCVMLYDWNREVNESWIEILEAIFDALGAVPAEATSNIGGKNLHGPYLKSKDKLRNFLEKALDYGEFDVRIRSSVTHHSDQAFPSDYEFSFNGSKIRRKKLCVAARHGHIHSSDYLMNIAGEILIRSTGSCYGAAFDFPAAFGPSFYLSSIAFSPQGIAWDANQAYADRITRWRDRTARGKLSPSAGYFREVYEINLLTDAHLGAPFKNGLFGEFARSAGIVHSLPYCDGMHRWDVPRGTLQKVQGLMESSGLVLSA